MSKTVVTFGTLLLSVLILSGTVLLVMGKDPSAIFTFAASTIIPAASLLWLGQKVEKTQDATEQVVSNTNGRMTELIENNRLLTEKVAVLSGALDPDTFTETYPVEPGLAEPTLNHLGIPMQETARHLET